MQYLYDEYQRSLRHRNGYYAFIFICILITVNGIVGVPWAETRELEYYIIAVIAIASFILPTIYQGAYFTKNERPLFFSITFTLIGLFNLLLLINKGPDLLSLLIVDGKMSYDAFFFLSNLLFILMPFTYFASRVVEKIKAD